MITTKRNTRICLSAGTVIIVKDDIKGAKADECLGEFTATLGEDVYVTVPHSINVEKLHEGP
jgi:hypothetical protein